MNTCANCKWDFQQKVILKRPSDKKRVCRDCIYHGTKYHWEERTNEQKGERDEEV